MPANCRFAFAVHVLAVLARRLDEGATSELLAGSVNTNPVVIRRLLAALREAGLVQTQGGARGGARLARAANEITLADVHRALGCSGAFALHPQTPNPRCPVGREIETVLRDVFSSAQSAVERELARRTVADVLAELTAGTSG